MKLSYKNPIGNQVRQTINATITTDHPASSYGQPVILLEDGAPLGLTSWVLLAYQVEEASGEEIEQLQQFITGHIARLLHTCSSRVKEEKAT